MSYTDSAHERADKRRTIEARLDRLRKRLDAMRPYPGDPPDPMVAVMKGTLDLLADVLLEDEPR